MGLARIERILILAKTYPSPSAQYVEASCVRLPVRAVPDFKNSPTPTVHAAAPAPN